MSKPLPVVVIVGRMNVGKSTLFNRLSVDVKSMVLDYHGVTRDIIKDEVSWMGRNFELVDTGGIRLKKSEDDIVEQVRQRALVLIEKADLVLFVVDGRAGIVVEDREISSILHKLNPNVMLVVNKIDTPQAIEETYEFENLRHNFTFFVSAQHGKGISDLLDAIVQKLPVKKTIEQAEPHFKVVLLGKPNVGKSSLMNLLVNEERAIVADLPGTTREALSEHVSFYQEDILVTDTPGIRRKRSVDTTLETLMVKSSMHALEDADIVLLLIDAASNTLADQELKLAFYAFTQKYKALVVLFNKQDLVDDAGAVLLKDSLSRYQYFLKKIPQLSISCKSGKNVGKVLPLAKQVWDRYHQTLPDSEISGIIRQALRKNPLMHKKSQLLVYGARQIKKAPITILLLVNEPEWFEESQMAFFDNLLRTKFDLKGVPVKFIARKP